ncbi:MAG: bifunctional hydroxymethylpyrimidine kinase/phosphomethylpyrimidine kinase, partial [Candidatus Hydrothermae bacterium]|nr:bifunctional hydroxymethylpyrimidine kinase/phosphomethylpyrimidine kinase [Candidatus Hydrothermae bacterium]
SGETVLKELEAIYTEFKPKFVKVGLVPLPELMESILNFLRTKQLSCLIIDPIIKAGTGDPLASNKIKETILGNPLPNTIITPNIKEAEFLTGLSIESFEDVKKAAERLENYGFKGILIKGGHGKGNQIQDVFLYENEFQIFTHPRFPHEIHGTGCTLSSLILSYIAHGHSPPEAVEKSIGEIENWIKNGKLIKLSCSYVFQ